SFRNSLSSVLLITITLFISSCCNSFLSSRKQNTTTLLLLKISKAAVPSFWAPSIITGFCIVFEIRCKGTKKRLSLKGVGSLSHFQLCQQAPGVRTLQEQVYQKR